MSDTYVRMSEEVREVVGRSAEFALVPVPAKGATLRVVQASAVGGGAAVYSRTVTMAELAAMGEDGAALFPIVPAKGPGTMLMAFNMWGILRANGAGLEGVPSTMSDLLLRFGAGPMAAPSDTGLGDLFGGLNTILGNDPAFAGAVVSGGLVDSTFAQSMLSEVENVPLCLWPDGSAASYIPGKIRTGVYTLTDANDWGGTGWVAGDTFDIYATDAPPEKDGHGTVLTVESGTGKILTLRVDDAGTGLYSYNAYVRNPSGAGSSDVYFLPLTDPSGNPLTLQVLVTATAAPIA